MNKLLIVGAFQTKGQATDAELVINTYSSLTDIDTEVYATTSAEYKAAASYFAQSPKPKQLIIAHTQANGDKSANETAEAIYTKVAVQDNSFYGVVIVDKTAERQVAVAKLVEADKKLFGVSTEKTEVIANLTNFNRTFVLHHSKAKDTYAEAAWFGKMFTKDAGSATWAFKELATVEADKLSTTEVQAIKALNYNFFTNFGGKAIALEGKALSGEYLDIMQATDWLSLYLQSGIANLLLQSDKIPMTNDGIAMVESVIRNSLNEAAQRNLIDKSSIAINVPNVLDISTELRASRTIEASFSARLQGAIHVLHIKGTVTI
jgi:hypothetical protein